MHNPWIPIADLLSGFVVIALLLFAGAAVLPRFEEAARLEAQGPSEQETPSQREAHRRQGVFIQLHRLLASEEREGLLSVDVGAQMIALHDVSFERGSACLGDAARAALHKVATTIVRQMTDEPTLEVHIEGHTDPSPVNGVTERCGVFADNTQLSALRATNARDVLMMAAPIEQRGRMPVTGYGPDRLRNVGEPSAAENRRVELRWIWRVVPGEVESMADVQAPVVLSDSP